MLAFIESRRPEKVKVHQEVRISVLSLEHVPHALASRDTRRLIKVIADARTQRLLDAYMLAPEGVDSIQSAALAIRHGMSAQDPGATLFP